MAHYIQCHSKMLGVVWRKVMHEDRKNYQSPMRTRYCITSTVDTALISTRPAQPIIFKTLKKLTISTLINILIIIIFIAVNYCCKLSK